MQCKNNLEFCFFYSSNIDQFLKGTKKKKEKLNCKFFVIYFFSFFFRTPEKNIEFLITLHFKFIYHKNRIQNLQ